MPSLIVKRLRQSELGWFRAVRDQKRETGKQRALNIDTAVLVEVFGRLPEDTLPLVTRYFDGERLVEDQRPLRHQHKNWRLTGDAVRGRHFEDVRPDDIVLLLVEPLEATNGAPAWRVTWDHVSQRARTTASLFELCGRQLQIGADSPLGPPGVRGRGEGGTGGQSIVNPPEARAKSAAPNAQEDFPPVLFPPVSIVRRAEVALRAAGLRARRLGRRNGGCPGHGAQDRTPNGNGW